MANIKSQIKRIGTNEKARLRNKGVKSSLKTAVRRFRTAADAGDVDVALVELTDLAPVDNNIYFSDGFAYAVATGEGEDQPVSDVVSSDYGVRTYLYTKFELVTIRSAG